MKLYELTTIIDDTGENVVRVFGRLSDNPDPAEQKEYITFQFATEAQANLGGGILHLHILELILEQVQKAKDAAWKLRGQSAKLPANLL